MKTQQILPWSYFNISVYGLYFHDMLIDLLDFHSRKYSSKFILRYFNLEPTKLMMLRFLRSQLL